MTLAIITVMPMLLVLTAMAALIVHVKVGFPAMVSHALMLMNALTGAIIVTQTLLVPTLLVDSRALATMVGLDRVITASISMNVQLLKELITVILMLSVATQMDHSAVHVIMVTTVTESAAVTSTSVRLRLTTAPQMQYAAT